MGEFEPIVQDRSVSAKIAEQILLRIQQGIFPVGTKLPAETELARQFGASRPTVREALGALQFVGYIDSSRGSGSRIVSVDPVLAHTVPTMSVTTPNEIIDLFEARLLIEPRVAAISALTPDMEKLAEAEATIQGMSVVVAEPAMRVESDLRVHRALAAVCPNTFLRESAIGLIEAAASPALQAIREQAWTSCDLPALWEGQQHALLAAIRMRDSDSAAEASWIHLASAARNALSILTNNPDLAAGARERLELLLANGPAGRR